MSPSKAEAAYWLRWFADTIDWQPRPDPALDRARLRLIADCIDGGQRWRKASQLTIEQRSAVEALARMKPRPRVKLPEHLDELAVMLARRFDWRGPDDIERARGLIVRARKRFQEK